MLFLGLWKSISFTSVFDLHMDGLLGNTQSTGLKMDGFFLLESTVSPRKQFLPFLQCDIPATPRT